MQRSEAPGHLGEALSPIPVALLPRLCSQVCVRAPARLAPRPAEAESPATAPVPRPATPTLANSGSARSGSGAPSSSAPPAVQDQARTRNRRALATIWAEVAYTRDTVQIRNVDVELHAANVTVRRGDRPIASGVWRGGKIVERVGCLPETVTWSEIEAAIVADAKRVVEVSQRSAYDSRGVDVTQIDRMLTLSPHERLRRLDSHRDAVLQLLGRGPSGSGDG